jgi:hypothetical protein
LTLAFTAIAGSTQLRDSDLRHVAGDMVLAMCDSATAMLSRTAGINLSLAGPGPRF